MASNQESSDKNCGDWRVLVHGVIPKLNHALINQTFADVSFKFPNRNIVKAHKLLLALSSTVFEKMFVGHFEERNQTVDKPIDIKDVDQDVFSSMLEFIYTGKCPIQEYSWEHIMNILYAAVKYAVFDLQTFCSDELKLRISDENVINIFQRSKFLQVTGLADRATSYIQFRFEHLLKYDEFLEISRENLCMLLEDEKTSVDDELKLFTALLKWSDVECRRQNLQVSPHNQRVLGNVLGLIQFTKMRIEDVTLKVASSCLLTSEEIVLLLQHMTVSPARRSNLSNLPFKHIPRQPLRLVYCAKFGNNEFENISSNVSQTTFSVNQAIAIVGSGYRGQVNVDMKKFIISGVIQLFKLTPPNLLTIAEARRTVLVQDNSIFNMDFDRPVPISPYEKYRLRFDILEGPNLPFSLACQRTISNVDNGTVKFDCEFGGRPAEIRYIF